VHFTETTTVPHYVISSADAFDRVWQTYMEYRLKSTALLCSCSINTKESESGAKILTKFASFNFLSVSNMIKSRHLYKCLLILDLIHLTKGV
jgi:hypothetical protein